MNVAEDTLPAVTHVRHVYVARTCRLRVLIGMARALD